MNQLRSLNIEHVSPAGLMQQEISRRTTLGQQASKCVQHGNSLPLDTILALMRRWFWTRKPDAGFALSGFPATLLQAKVFDEWLEARGEALDILIHDNSTSVSHVIDHYLTQGITNCQPPPLFV